MLSYRHFKYNLGAHDLAKGSGVYASLGLELIIAIAKVRSNRSWRKDVGFPFVVVVLTGVVEFLFLLTIQGGTTSYMRGFLIDEWLNEAWCGAGSETLELFLTDAEGVICWIIMVLILEGAIGFLVWIILDYELILGRRADSRQTRLQQLGCQLLLVNREVIHMLHGIEVCSTSQWLVVLTAKTCNLSVTACEPSHCCKPVSLLLQTCEASRKLLQSCEWRTLLHDYMRLVWGSVTDFQSYQEADTAW